MKYIVLFGGSSYEHEISIISAITIKKIIKNEVIFIYCDEFRHFYLIKNENMHIKTFINKTYIKDKLFLDHGGFFASNIWGKRPINANIIINLIHGQDGEDGKVASLLEFYGLKYLGPNIEASVISYNKIFTKFYAKNLGINTINYEIINQNSKKNYNNFPCIIKPVHLGSSIGISVARNQKEFDYALDVGFEYDDELIIEPFINNILEYNLAGCKINNEFIFSSVEEPFKKDLLDFDTKYLSFSNENKVKKANISPSLEHELKENFKKIYNDLFTGALIRCDFFVLDDRVYLNEINPNPGSMAHYLFDDFNSVLDKLALNLKNEKNIKINYKLLYSIKGAKV